jgi:plasmid stabilization system protein ParE
LLRIPELARLDREELQDMVVEAWLTRAEKSVARAWLEANRLADDEPELGQLEHGHDRERRPGDEQPGAERQALRPEGVLEERHVDHEHDEDELPDDREVEPPVRERPLEGDSS